MFINMKEITSLFSSFDTYLYGGTSGQCLCGFRETDFSATSSSSYILYVTDDPFLIAGFHPENDIHYLLCSNTSSDKTNIPEDALIHCLQVNECSVATAVQLLESFFIEACGRGLYAESLLKILFAEDGIQAMIDISYSVFFNPLMVFDAGYHLIAANWEEVSASPVGKRIVENGGFSESEFELANNNDHIHKKLMRSETPIRIKHPELTFEQMLCPISTDKDVGHIVLNALDRPIQPHDADFLLLLQKAINQQMKKDEFIQNNRGFHYEYFIRDLLDGKIAIPMHHMNHMDYVGGEFPNTLYCLVVETARSSSTLNTLHIRAEFERLFPSAKTLLYNGEIVVIINQTDQKELTDDETKKLHQICVDHGIYAGLSNQFEGITCLSEYYKQALRAIELGVCQENQPALFLYKDYYMQHLTNLFTQKESPDTFCHPKMKMLFAYDKEHDTDLARSLYMYLVNERNYSATADALFIHRNTLIYRIKRINQMISVDYNDYHERQYLILSYKLNCALMDFR